MNNWEPLKLEGRFESASVLLTLRITSEPLSKQSEKSSTFKRKDNTLVQRFRGSGFRGSQVQRFRVQRFTGSEVQGSGVQGSEVQGSEVQGFRGSGVQGFRGSGFLGHGSARINTDFYCRRSWVQGFKVPL
jgi:hypothetical protein